MNGTYLTINPGGELALVPGAPREYATWAVKTKVLKGHKHDEQSAADSWIALRSVEGLYVAYDHKTGKFLVSFKRHSLNNLCYIKGLKANSKSPHYWLRTKFHFSKTEDGKRCDVITLRTGKGKYLGVSESGALTILGSKDKAGWTIENAHTKWPSLLSELYAELEQTPGTPFLIPFCCCDTYLGF